MKKIILPNDFLFGVATSAAQIEGAAQIDGRKNSIWDEFAQKEGAIGDKSNPSITCDFYNRYKEDIALAKSLNIGSLRFSFSWSRIFPEGYGKVNQKGLDFYKNLVYELHRNNIVPNATLYHWDLPQALEERGGWLNGDIIEMYGEFATTLFKTFGDEIPIWATINEPIATYVGYALGIFAPGYKSETKGRQANHNILLAHGEGVKRFRDENMGESKIGIVVDVWNHHPYRKDNIEDIKKAELENEKTYRSYLNPILNGGYTKELLKYMDENKCMPIIKEGDFEKIKQPIDYFGLNCYNRVVDCADENLLKNDLTDKKTGGNFQANGNEFYPKAVYDALKILKNDYKFDKPIYITENGTPSFNEKPDENGEIHDNERIEYIKGFLYWTKKAIDEGIDVRGYYLWSLLDNWEWSCGFDMQFGLTHINFETQFRTVKDSGKWYSKIIKERCFEIGLTEYKNS